MVYVIQTNISIDKYDVEHDFQSMVFHYKSWDKYKNDLLDENEKHEIIQGTMIGSIKGRNCKVTDVIINDDYHINVFVNNGYMTTNIKAYKVDEDMMNFIIKYKK